jgi:hypothetical protein
MNACVIMHNMIIVNEHGQDLDYDIMIWWANKGGRNMHFLDSCYNDTHDADVHYDPKDPIENWWSLFGQQIR